jgi:YbbR domain-containing protein
MREFILKNFWLKVFSLVLAALIWAVIEASLRTDVKVAPPNPLRPLQTREFRLPITVMISANNRRVFKIDPPDIKVKVRGDDASLEKLEPDDIRVYVNLVDVPEPEGSFLVEVNVPRDITLQDFWPAHVRVQPVAPGTH